MPKQIGGSVPGRGGTTPHDNQQQRPTDQGQDRCYRRDEDTDDLDRPLRSPLAPDRLRRMALGPGGVTCPPTSPTTRPHSRALHAHIRTTGTLHARPRPRTGSAAVTPDLFPDEAGRVPVVILAMPIDIELLTTISNVLTKRWREQGREMAYVNSDLIQRGEWLCIYEPAKKDDA